MTETFSAVPGDSRCECSDSGCKAGRTDAKGCCLNVASVYLYRVDMEDVTGTYFCEDCAEDAMESGLFTDREDDTEDEGDDETPTS